MPLASIDTIEAVVLFSEGKISRELLYPEFEAILDSFLPVPDFRGQTAQAVYLVINSNLLITSAVFFQLDFDAKGMADRRWNVPLQNLAEVSGKGPDLGAGPIRLACFSQCAIEWQQKKLWDPVMEPENNSFAQLKKSVQNNRMGLIFRQSSGNGDDIPTITDTVKSSESHVVLQQKIHAHYSKELRDRMAGMIKEHRLRISTLNSKHQDATQKLQLEHQRRIQAYQERLQEFQGKNAELEVHNQTLKENLDIQANKAEGIREYFPIS